MDWSAMFTARVVVMGCGNTLFGDDGVAPRAVSHLAEEAKATGEFADVAFIDAGTSFRSLLTDLALSPSALQRLIVVDVVQEAGREAGSIAVEYIQKAQAEKHADAASGQNRPTLGNNFLHQAPTRALLHTLHATMGIELIIVTVQADCIPPFMDDHLSPAALASLPLLHKTLRDLCRTGNSDSITASPQTLPSQRSTHERPL